MFPTPPAAFALAVTRVCRCDDDVAARRSIGRRLGRAGTVGPGMTWDLDRAYRDHLTAGDLAVLGDLVGERSLTDALSSPELDEVVFGPVAVGDPRCTASRRS